MSAFDNFFDNWVSNKAIWLELKTSQELQMLSIVTIDGQVTKIVLNPGSQLSVWNQCLKCHKSLWFSNGGTKVEQKLKISWKKLKER